MVKCTDMKRRLVIFVSIPTVERAERLKFEGVLAYAHEKTGTEWHIQPDPGGLLPSIAKDPRRFNIDGIIAYVTDEKNRKDLSSTSCPTVLIEDLNEPEHPIVGKNVLTLVCDHFAEGKAAATHFLDLRFSNFAYVGPTRPTAWADIRLRGFANTLSANGFPCSIYPKPSGSLRDNFALEIDRLAFWLKGLPKPCALLACRDTRARQCLYAAESIGIPVPESLAILGVDDDEITCTTVNPHLSSVSTSDRTIGYAAGRLLKQLILKRGRGRIVRAGHPHVVARQSTDTTAISDRIVSEVIRFAKSHLQDDLTTEALARHVCYTKASLQRRFHDTLGISLSEEIRRLRLSKACAMLLETTKSVEDIAQECGFAGTSHLCKLMRESIGRTPFVFRKERCEAVSPTGLLE